MNRRRFLGAAAGVGAAALAADAAWWEPRSLDVTRHALPPGSPPVRFVQISDLHLRALTPLHRRIADETARARPHFAVLTGDSLDEARHLPAVDAFLALLDPRLPKFAILGNWEHWSGVDLADLARVYERHNVRLLVNETVVHAGVTLTGVDDLAGAPDLRRALRGVAGTPLHLLLAHSPAFRDSVPSYGHPAGIVKPEAVAVDGIGMMLSGHTHGGQVTLAGWAPLLPPGSGRYARGWFRDGGGPPLYVSRGIGTSMLPVRLGARPELAIFG